MVIKRLLSQPGSDYPIYDDLKKYVVDAVRQQVRRSIGNCSLYSWALCRILAAEAAKTAQEIQVMRHHTRDDAGRMENLEITEGVMADLVCQTLAPSSAYLVKTTVVRATVLFSNGMQSAKLVC